MMITVRHRPEEDKGQSEDETTAIYSAILKKPYRPSTIRSWEG
jgi:hypothetical protein